MVNQREVINFAKGGNWLLRSLIDFLITPFFSNRTFLPEFTCKKVDKTINFMVVTDEISPGLLIYLDELSL